MDSELFGGFFSGQHTAFAKTIESGKQSVTMNEISDALGIETVPTMSRPCGSTGTKSPLIQNDGDF